MGDSTATNPSRVSRERVQRELVAYLRRYLVAQETQSIRMTPILLDTMLKLVNKQILLYKKMVKWLKGDLPGDPVHFAEDAAKCLPTEMDGSVVRMLRKQPVGPPAPSRLDKAAKLLKGDDVAGPPGRLEMRDPPWSDDRIEGMQNQRRQAAGKSELDSKWVPPAPVDLLKVMDMLKPDKELPSPPEPPRVYPAVEQAIDKSVTPEELVPPNLVQRCRLAWKAYEEAGPDEERARYKELTGARDAAGEWADAQAVARSVAHELDLAQERGESKIRLDLGDSYNRFPNPEQVFRSLCRIIRLVRDRLPGRASGVRQVEVYFGGDTLRRVIPVAPEN
jgi:hypothetical protein